MSGNLPSWIEKLLDTQSPAPGEGTFWNLEFHWPWAALPSAAIATLAACWVLYFYIRESPGAGRWAKTLLAAMRLGLFALLALMIGQLMLALHRTGLPEVVVVVDNSQSMGIADRYDSRSRQSQADKSIKKLGLADATRLNLAKSILLRKGGMLADLEKRYKLKVYFLSDHPQPAPANPAELRAALEQLKPDGQATRLGYGVQTILNELRGAPPTAMIILSDGITSSGESLTEAAQLAERNSVPLFTVALGSEKSPRDLELRDLIVDEVVFADDVVNFQFTIRSSGLAGRRVQAVLREEDTGEVLARTNITLSADDSPQAGVLPYRPSATGEFEYVVELSPLPDETNTENNSQSRTVSVRKEKIRVLLVQAYPNYEYRYLKNLLSRDSTIELRSILQDADPPLAEVDPASLAVFPVRRDELFEYDVIILGDVNPALLSTSGLENVRDFVAEKGGGMVLIAGPQYMPMAYRDLPLAALVPVELPAAVGPAVGDFEAGFQVQPTELGLLAPQMQLGDTLEETKRIWKNLPELFWLFEVGRLKPAARLLAEHPSRTGPDGGRLPVFCSQYFGAGQVLLHATDETWRWRYRVGDAIFARYWIQAIRGLSRSKLLGKDRSVDLITDRREYHSGDEVRIRARFLDMSLAPAATGAVTVVVQQPQGRQQRIQLAPSGASRGLFEATLSGADPGKYHAFLAAPALRGKSPATDFLVVAPPGEMARTAVDVAELTGAAHMTRGRFYRFAEAPQLVDDLPQGSQLPLETLPPRPLWNKWWMLTVFFGLLVGEWVLRKRRGLL